MQQHTYPALLIAVGLTIGALSGAANAADSNAVPLIISGCVVAGEAKDSFLLTNVQLDGTTAAPAHAFYRFNTTKGLKEYVGRRVEVTGKADLTDVDTGKVRVRTKDGKATAEITSERRTVKVEETWFGSMGAIKLDAEVPTYKFEVEKVMPLSGSCTAAGAAR